MSRAQLVYCLFVYCLYTCFIHKYEKKIPFLLISRASKEQKWTSSDVIVINIYWKHVFIQKENDRALQKKEAKYHYTTIKNVSRVEKSAPSTSWNLLIVFIHKFFISFLKYGGSEVKNKLMKIRKMIFEKGKVPSDFRRPLIKPLDKKGIRVSVVIIEALVWSL